MNLVDRSLWIEPYHFHYCTQGRSNNFPILFLHGFMGNCYEFSEVMSFFSNHYYCIAVDLPGHGKTATHGDEPSYTMSRTASGLIQFLDALNISSCFLAGYSMGGRLALYLTLHFPNYFSKVVLESASPGLKTKDEQFERLQKDWALASALETEGFESFLIKWYKQPLFASLSVHPSFHQVVEQRLQNNPFHLARSLRNMSTGCQPSLWDSLKNNSVSILLLVGALDQKFVDINIQMANLNPLITLEILDQCGHNIHVENPAGLTKKIMDFLH